jgi:hypothetical protein
VKHVKPRSAPRVALVTCPVVAALILACSSKPHSHPPALGDCTGEGTAGCAAPASQGGSAGPSDGGIADSEAAVEDASGCGTVGALLMTANTLCAQCLTQFCCLADLSCTTDPECVGIVMCAEQTGAVTNCEVGMAAGSIANYRELAFCVSNPCGQQCFPGLPLPTVQDF